MTRAYVRWFLAFVLANVGAYFAFTWLNDYVLFKYQSRSVREQAHAIVAAELPRFDILPVDQWEEATRTLHKRWDVPARLLSVEMLPADAWYKIGFFDNRVSYYWDFPGGAYAFMVLRDKESVVEIGPFRGLMLMSALDNVAAMLIWGLINGGILLALFRNWQRRSSDIEQATRAFLSDGIARYVADSDSDALGAVARSVNQMALRAEHLLHQRQQMISEQRELLHAVAHECRAPLARVNFALEMLEHSESAAQRGKLARDMEVAISEIDGLVRELLTYARLQHGAQRLSLNECDLQQMVEDIIGHTRELYPGIQFMARPPAEVLRPWADGRLLARVVTNLVRNAACFAASRVDVHWQRDGEYFELMVDDDGPGVPFEQRERIFEPFARLDPSRSRDSGGMGLGLAIVLGISRRHHGEVSVLDSPAGGARFLIRWPLRTADFDSAAGSLSPERLH